MHDRRNTTLVCTFDDREHAETAVRRLQLAGFSDDGIDLTTTTGIGSANESDHRDPSRTLLILRSDFWLDRGERILQECGGLIEHHSANSRRDDASLWTGTGFDDDAIEFGDVERPTPTTFSFIDEHEDGTVVDPDKLVTAGLRGESRDLLDEHVVDADIDRFRFD